MLRPWQGNLRERPGNPTNLRPVTLLQCHAELARPLRSRPEGRNRSAMSLLNCAPSECRGQVHRARSATIARSHRKALAALAAVSAARSGTPLTVDLVLSWRRASRGPRSIPGTATVGCWRRARHAGSLLMKQPTSESLVRNDLGSRKFCPLTMQSYFLVTLFI